MAVVLLWGTCRGDCGAVGETVVLSGGMQSGWLWCCWGEPVGESVELSGRLWSCRGECCRGDSGAVGVTVVLLGGTCRGDCGAVGETVVLSG